MPVRFFPTKPIELLDKFILKEDGTPLRGEIDIYRLIQERCERSIYDWYVWHDLDLPFHSDSFNPKGKTNSQIDFLILNNKGLLILEVKGGPISCKDQTFYYGNNFESRMFENPFSQ